jgi:putative DNA primase/helicase
MEPKPFRGATGAWATAIVTRELEALALAQPGTRNESLNVTAFRLGQLVGGGEVDEDAIIGALLNVVMDWPELSKHRDTIMRAVNAGSAYPRRYPAKERR